MQERSLYELRRALLAARNLPFASGEPLYTYLFDTTEYEAIKQALTAYGASALRDVDGRALFVAFAAEWFRRDRADGHWDWGRPCEAIGITYGGSLADISYAEIQDAVRSGLQTWKRPRPAGDAPGKKWIMAVVSECGFPTAALERGGALHTWLSNALDLAERGHDLDYAVEREAWRVPDTLVGAVIDTAKLLCAALLVLRGRLHALSAEGLGVDPIAYLDATDPHWRDALPVVAQDEHAASLINDLVKRAKPAQPILSIGRVLQREAGAWRARAEIAVDGACPATALPEGLRAFAGSHTRFTIRVLGYVGEQHSAPIATLEKEGLAADEEVWVLAKRQTSFAPNCPLNAQIDFSAEANGVVLTNFVTAGGESLVDTIAAFRIDGEPETVSRLEFLSAASARVRDPWIGLCGPSTLIARLQVEGEKHPLGKVDDALELVGVRGKAWLEGKHERYVWRTGSPDEDRDELVLDGAVVGTIRETVFRGMPRIALVARSGRTGLKIEKLHWRPLSSGAWRSPGRTPPFGAIELAQIDAGEIVARRTVHSAPTNFAVTALSGKSQRRIRLTGATDARVAASTTRDGARFALDVERADDEFEIDLSGAPNAAIIDFDIDWPETRLRVSMRDPTTRTALVSPSGQVISSIARLSVGDLRGWRLHTGETTLLKIELGERVNGRMPGTIVRIVGETPLQALQDQIKAVLASTASAAPLDAVVRLSWLGPGGHFAEIRWYDGDRPTEQAREFEAISLVRPEICFSVPSDDLLDAALSANGGGPFVIFARSASGSSWSRPCFKPGRPFDRSGLSPLQLACALEAQSLRLQAIAAQLDDGLALDHADMSFVRAAVDVAIARAPFASFDLLRALGAQADAAVACLAFANGPGQLTNLLSLEDELSFAWGASRVEAWRRAFDKRAEIILEKLELGEAGRPLVLSTLARWLSHISATRPALAGHVSLVAGAWWQQYFSVARGCEELIALARRMERVCARDGLRASESALIDRQAEAYWPQLDLVKLLGAEASAVPYDPSRRDIIAAPHVAALIANDRIAASHEAIAACREARLFDPYYFDDVLPRAMVARAGGAACFDGAQR